MVHISKANKQQKQRQKSILHSLTVVPQVCGRKIHLSRVLMKFDLLLFLSLEERLVDLERPCAPPRCPT